MTGAMLPDARSVEQLVDTATRELVAATRGSDASAEMQASVIRTARALRDNLLEMLSQARACLDEAQQRVERESRALTQAQERLRADQQLAAEDRTRLDDEKLRRFIAKSDASSDPEARHVAEERQRLVDERGQLTLERQQLVEERRQIALAGAGDVVEQVRLAEEARVSALARQTFLEGWIHRIQMASVSHISDQAPTHDARSLADERRQLDVERLRLAEDTKHLELRAKQVEADRLCLEQQLNFLAKRGPQMEGLLFAKDPQQAAGCAAPLQRCKEESRLLPSVVRQQLGLERWGRLDELHAETRTWQR